MIDGKFQGEMFAKCRECGQCFQVAADSVPVSLSVITQRVTLMADALVKWATDHRCSEGHATTP